MQNRYQLSQIEKALTFFDIDQKIFSRIHTQELKKQYLRYKYLRKELTVVQSFLNQSMIEIKAQLDHCELAYRTLINSEIVLDHKNIYSHFSRGLQEIDIRTLRAVASGQALDVSVLEMKRKESGIEPGFEGIQTETILMHIDEMFPDNYARREFLKKYHADIKALYEELKKSVPKFLIKFAFEESRGDKLIPSERNIRQTQAVKKLNQKHKFFGDIATVIIKMSKTTTIAEKNIEAVREVFANDYARVAGMLVQDQVLYVGESDHGLLQFMPKGLWENEASVLGELAGGASDAHYLVLRVIKTLNQVSKLSDYTIQNLGRYLLVMLEEGDHDGIGSRAQNKLRLGNKLFGIDFGHPFQANIIHKVGSDFHLADQKFKNYSIFYDRPRSEFVSGLLILAKLSGRIVESSVIESYGEEFSALYQTIVPYADTVLFGDYHRKFFELAASFSGRSETDKKNKANCDAILEDLVAMQAMAKSSRQSLLQKFEMYLMLPARYVDFVENLEKLMMGKDNLALYSEDGTVLMNQIRLLRRPEMNWSVDRDVKAGRWILKARFQSEGARRQAFQNLLKWEPLKNAINYFDNDIAIGLDLSSEQLDHLAELCSDRLIKTAYFPFESGLHQRYQNDIELQMTLRQLVKIGINAELSNDESNEDLYIVRMAISPMQSTRVEMEEVIQESFAAYQLTLNQNCCQMTFDYAALPNINKMMRAIPEKLNVIKTINDCLEKFLLVDQVSVLSGKYLRMSRTGYMCELVISDNANQIFSSEICKLARKFLDQGRYLIPAVELSSFMMSILDYMQAYSKLSRQIKLDLACLEKFLVDNNLSSSFYIQENKSNFILIFRDVATNDLTQRVYTELGRVFGAENNIVAINYENLSAILPEIQKVIVAYEANTAAIKFAEEIVKRETELSSKQRDLQARNNELELLKSKNKSANSFAQYLAKMDTIYVELQKLIVDLQANSSNLPLFIHSTIGLFSGSQHDTHLPAGMLIDEIEAFMKRPDQHLYLEEIRIKLGKRLDFVKEKNESRYTTQIDLIPIILSDLDEAIKIAQNVSHEQLSIRLAKG